MSNYVNKIISLEEKFVELDSGLRWDIWKGISFRDGAEFLHKAKEIKPIKFDDYNFSLEKTVIFFMDFFDLILRSRLVTLTKKEFEQLRKILVEKGVRALIESEEKIDVKLLSYKHNDMDMFYPTKILERIIYGDEKDFSKTVGFLTEGEYPTDCIIKKWMDNFGKDKYLEIV